MDLDEMRRKGDLNRRHLHWQQTSRGLFTKYYSLESAYSKLHAQAEADRFLAGLFQDGMNDAWCRIELKKQVAEIERGERQCCPTLFSHIKTWLQSNIAIDGKEIEVLEHDWHDGILLGICLWEGERHYFHWMEDGYQNIYGVYQPAKYYVYDISSIPDIKRWEELEQFEKIGEFDEEQIAKLN